MDHCGICLYLNGSARAVELYKEAFGLELGYHVLNPDGSYYHSELYRGESEILSVVESKEKTVGGNAVQLCFTFEDRDSLKKALNLLAQGGTVTMELCELPWSPCAAALTDRFGVMWYLTVPQHRPPDSFVPES